WTDMGKPCNGGWDRTIGLDNRNGPLRYSAFTGTGPITGTPAPESTEDWSFIAAVYNEDTAQMAMYVDLDASSVNDDLVAVGSTTTFNDAPTEFSIGTVGPTNAGEGWVGGIDNVFVFSAALTAEEITAVRNAGTAQPSYGDNPDLFVSGFPALSALTRSPSAKPFNIQLRNRGVSEALAISSVEITGRDAAYFVVDSFPATVEPNQLANIAFTLDSFGQVGGFTAVMTIASNDESQPEIQLNLTATVLPEVTEDPVLTVLTPTPFGDLPANPGTVTRDITIKNDGATLDLNLATATITGADAANYSIVNAPTSVMPGAQGTYSVAFKPEGRAGTFAATLRLVSNDGSDRFTDVSLNASVAFGSLTEALLGFYTFDDSANPNADSSASGNDLEPGGAEPVYEANGGFEGGAYDFTGANLVIPINLNPTVVPELTVGAWVKTSALDPGLHRVISTDNGGWDRAIGLDSRDPDGSYKFSAFHGGGVVSGLPAPEDEDAWSFFAGSFSEADKTLTLFLDLDASSTNDPLQTVTFEGTTFGAGSTVTSLGSLTPTGGEGWIGYIDNVFVFGAVLSAEQLTSFRNGGSAAILGGGNIEAFEIVSAEPVLLEGGATGIALGWEGGPAQVAYIVEFSTDLIFWEEVADGVDGTSYTATLDAGATEIYYRVRVE
ncbi:MAG: choice-of-anchor D domain-containing protein, partial [Verrucomicrobiae bacterium]|nr:choice-of-anchor D domain-containing protein [Verrucomicrobiae bacterium]